MLRYKGRVECGERTKDRTEGLQEGFLCGSRTLKSE